MTNEQIRDFLEKHAEKQFKDFTSSLIPGTDSILGVRLPVLRLLAKQLAKEEWRTYLKEAVPFPAPLRVGLPISQERNS